MDGFLWLMYGFYGIIGAGVGSTYAAFFKSKKDVPKYAIGGFVALPAALYLGNKLMDVRRSSYAPSYQSSGPRTTALPVAPVPRTTAPVPRDPRDALLV